MAKIDLGAKMAEMGSMAVDKPSKQPKVSYPSFHVRGKKELHDLPDEFDGHGHFKITSRSKTQRSGEPESYSHEIEIHHLEPVKGSEGKKSKQPDAGEKLDSALTKIEGEKAKKAEKTKD